MVVLDLLTQARQLAQLLAPPLKLSLLQHHKIVHLRSKSFAQDLKISVTLSTKTARSSAQVLVVSIRPATRLQQQELQLFPPRVHLRLRLPLGLLHRPRQLETSTEEFGVDGDRLPVLMVFGALSARLVRTLSPELSAFATAQLTSFTHPDFAALLSAPELSAAELEMILASVTAQLLQQTLILRQQQRLHSQRQK